MSEQSFVSPQRPRFRAMREFVSAREAIIPRCFRISMYPSRQFFPAQDRFRLQDLQLAFKVAAAIEISFGSGLLSGERSGMSR